MPLLPLIGFWTEVYHGVRQKGIPLQKGYDISGVYLSSLLHACCDCQVPHSDAAHIDPTYTTFFHYMIHDGVYLLLPNMKVRELPFQEEYNLPIVVCQLVQSTNIGLVCSFGLFSVDQKAESSFSGSLGM